MIPRIMVGTSPFLGAGQFGHRAHLYRRKFYHRPDNIVALLEYCAQEHGVRGVQVLADPVIVDAVKNVDFEPEVVAVVGLQDFKREIELVKDLDPRAVILHASRVDSRRVEEVVKELDGIREAFGVPVGIATHRPSETLPQWERSMKVKVDVYMVPLNPVGAFMGNQNVVEEVLTGTERTVIAKKTLAAGSLPPEEGIPYAARYADALAVGIAEEREADETFKIARKCF